MVQGALRKYSVDIIDVIKLHVGGPVRIRPVALDDILSNKAIHCTALAWQANGNGLWERVFVSYRWRKSLGRGI